MLDTFFYCTSPFISILGTLLGVLLGAFLNRLSRRGKIKIFQNNASIDIAERDSSGGYSPQKEITEHTVSVSVVLNFDFYNTSSYTRKIARNIKLNIINDRSNYKLRLKNDDTTKVIDRMIHKDEIKNINLLPNELRNINLSFGVNENFHEFIESNWELAYYNENNKLRKIKIDKNVIVEK